MLFRSPVKGLCPVGCSYCYARRMYKRFGWNPEIREDISAYDGLQKMRAGSKVFVGSTMELFGHWVTPLMRSNLFHVIEMYPKLTFIFLTKQPQNLPHEFPDNCWVGISASDACDLTTRGTDLEHVWAKIKFVSLEPLLGWSSYDTGYEAGWMERRGINWLIIGQQTPPKATTQPKVEWISEIITAADKAKIPVFLKNNLKNLLPAEYPFVTNPLRDMDFYLRQEYPRKES